jgi:hypothetical protein
MDNLQAAILVMALTATDADPRDAHGRRRQLTAEQLDVLADFGWRLSDIRGFVTSCRIAVLGRWRLASRIRVGSAQWTTADNE